MRMRRVFIFAVTPGSASPHTRGVVNAGERKMRALLRAASRATSRASCFVRFRKILLAGWWLVTGET
jgi:hypothetical protein